MVRVYKTWAEIRKRETNKKRLLKSDSMKISVIGTGYVGLSAAVGFAKKGHHVICYDIDGGKLDRIDGGKSTIYEPLIDEYLGDVVSRGFLKTSRNLKETIAGTDVSFVCVGTPSRRDGSIDLTYIEKVSEQIGEVLRTKKSYHVVVVKSTVLPETTEKVVLPRLEKFSGKKAGDFGLCMNPEFLREGCALEDFLKPDRIVIGELDKKSGDLLEKLYAGFDAPILRVRIKVAEMIKYASNAFLATKISYANEVGNICKKLGIDVYDVMNGVGLDRRISPHFLEAGCGFGGSCFPKDVSALVHKSRELGHEPKLLQEVLDTNERQKVKIVAQLEKKLGNLSGKKITLLGLAFKTNTDDVREAPSIRIIEELRRKGASISAHDPQANENMRKMFPDVSYAKETREALRGADAALILTDWSEYESLTDNDFNLMRNKVIIEGRKVLGKDVSFEGVCW
jgi:UDPglucose 6-dehydrogenase